MIDWCFHIRQNRIVDKNRLVHWSEVCCILYHYSRNGANSIELPVLFPQKYRPKKIISFTKIPLKIYLLYCNIEYFHTFTCRNQFSPIVVYMWQIHRSIRIDVIVALLCASYFIESSRAFDVICAMHIFDRQSLRRYACELFTFSTASCYFYRTKQKN